MATITFSTVDDTNLRDIDGTAIASMAVKYVVFSGSVGSLSADSDGTDTITSGELTLTTVGDAGTYTVVIDETSGDSLGAYTMTAV